MPLGQLIAPDEHGRPPAGALGSVHHLTVPNNGLATRQLAWVLHLWPLLLPLPTILLGGWVIIAWRFNGLYGQDPYAYYDYGVGPLRRSLLNGVPLTAMFWPLGYPILIAVASLMLGPTTAAGQIVNLLASGAAVCLIYLLGRDLLLQAGASAQLARRTGVLAAILLGLTGRVIESSVLIMADAVALATALLSAWALVRWCSVEEESRPHYGWLALSATALAWSVVTRWGQVILACAWFAAALPTIQRRRLRLWRSLAWAIIPAAAVLVAQFWFIVTVPPDASLGPLPFAGDLSLVNGTGSGWSFLHVFQQSFVNADGVRHYTLPNGVFYATGAFLPQYLTPLFLPAALLGLVVAVVTYRRSLLLLLAWPMLALLFDAGLAEQNPRFILAAIPPIAILAGLGLAIVWDRFQPRWHPLAIVMMAAGLLIVAVIGMRGIGALNSERNLDLQVADWAASQVPARATTLSFGLTLTLQHRTDLHVLDLSTLSQRALKHLTAYRYPLYTLVQVGAMNGQFAARSPGINYRFLRNNPGLIQIGTMQSYTLARVRSR